MASHLSRTHRPGLHATPPAPRHLIALAVAATLLGAHGLAGAQSSATPATGAAEAPAAASLGSVTITGRVPSATVAGFGSQPLAATPVSATVLGSDELRARGADRLADVTAADAAVSDAYNTTGYWDYLSVRGFLLDNRFNYRRDGLPINAETSIALANKASIELLKGISGMQAGTSAPGGLANFVVKRPDRDLMQFSAGWKSGNAYGLATDLSRRIGSEREIGLRINLAADRLNTTTDNTRGSRIVAAIAGDLRLAGGGLIEVEYEHSRQSQPSVPGFSLLGDRIPATSDGRVSLNNQAWSLPVVLQGDTASLRWSQPLAGGWKAVAHGMTQHLKSDDRAAFPYGCTAADGSWYGDRYCPDGSADLYDYRSEHERRRSDALDLGAQGSVELAGLTHRLATGLLLTRYQQRMQAQAYNWVGTVPLDGSGRVDPDPTQRDSNTNRDERSSELYLRDAIRLAPQWQAWIGLRQTRLHRESIRTTGAQASAYDRSFTTPWLSLSWDWAPQQLAYLSWGRGVESDVVPNRARYTNAGEALVSRSRQAELGLKGSRSGQTWSVAAFDIRRAQTAAVGSDCSSDSTGNTCTVVYDGVAHHRGVEGQIEQLLGAWRLGGSAMLLRARREGSTDATQEGQRAANVPERSLKARAGYAFDGALQG
ncbi:MAG TPA: TonB-dependent receptor, partial [Burkholderiaceae bacterium]|nr:TonB-dependent receptor [Burkholderiaceae bacterium]